MKIVENKTFDAERALYGSDGIVVKNCRFDGEADGESALKESRNIRVESCYWNLRYPFWHDVDLIVDDTELTDKCRAALWYSSKIAVENTKMHGIKALRECKNVRITDSDIKSPEFGWSTKGLHMENTRAEGEYFLLRGEKLFLKNVTFTGKYSFQYVKGAVIDRCDFNTKDAFWHAENVTVTDSVLKGEYLGWYSKNLTLIRCKIIGTQPLCYCRGLRLVDCEMENTDLAFEKSSVKASVKTHIDSVKNPLRGTVTAPSVGEIIFDAPWAKGKVIVR